MLIYFDLETSGLDPAECKILEWAAVITDDQHQVLWERSAIVKYEPAVLEAIIDGCSEYVLDMHAKNSLWEDLLTGSTTDHPAQWLEADLGQVAMAAGTRGCRPFTLAGFSTHFDLGFLRVHAPEFAACCSHRVFDISTLRRACTDRYGRDFAPPRRTGEASHRALADCHAAITYAQWFQDNCLAPVTGA